MPPSSSSQLPAGPCRVDPHANTVATWLVDGCRERTEATNRLRTTGGGRFLAGYGIRTRDVDDASALDGPRQASHNSKSGQPGDDGERVGEHSGGSRLGGVERGKL